MKLFPYQELGVKFLTSRKYALLADEQGIGKTAQAVCAVKELNVLDHYKAQTAKMRGVK